jgi:hypothetical protein
MKAQTKLIGIGAVALALGVAAYAFTASSEEVRPNFGAPFMRHGTDHMMGRGSGPVMMGMRHDSATMAQLRMIHELLINHDRIRRTVTNLPDGIRTETTSDNAEVAQLIKTHVSDMGRRVAAGDDPGLPMESPALRLIFRNKDKIRTSLETTAAGVIVVQTSDDPQTVAALQEHASQVSDLVQGGMHALHTAMMRNAAGTMQGGMGGGMMRHGMMHRRMAPGGMMRGPM